MKTSSLIPIIVSDNAEKALKFYEVLGFKTKFATKTTMGSSVYVIDDGNVELEIMETPKNPPVPMSAGLHGFRINVEDLDAAVETIKQAGGTVVAGPMENESQKLFLGKDADGNNITIMKWK